MQRKTERNDELERLRRRYAGRAKAGKGRLLDEFCEHHGYERKYAIKLLQGGAASVVARSRPGPPTDSVSQLTASALVHTLAPDMERTRSQFNVFGPNIQ